MEPVWGEIISVSVEEIPSGLLCYVGVLAECFSMAGL